jgi:hypothetical protein
MEITIEAGREAGLRVEPEMERSILATGPLPKKTRDGVASVRGEAGRGQAGVAYMKFIDSFWLHRGYMGAEIENGLQLRAVTP